MDGVSTHVQVRVLLNSGASAEHPGSDGRTPVDMAAANEGTRKLLQAIRRSYR